MSEVNNTLANLGLDPFASPAPAGEGLIRPEARCAMTDEVDTAFESATKAIGEVLDLISTYSGPTAAQRLTQLNGGRR